MEGRRLGGAFVAFGFGDFVEDGEAATAVGVAALAAGVDAVG